MRIRLDLTIVEKELLRKLLVAESSNPQHEEGLKSGPRLLQKLHAAWHNACTKGRS